MKNVAVSLIMISYMRSAINVYRICRNVKAWNWVLKHGDMSKKDIPIILRNTITSFLSSNGCKFKWTVYEGIRMGDVKPFSHNQQKFQMDGLNESPLTGLGKLCPPVHGTESNNFG